MHGDDGDNDRAPQKHRLSNLELLSGNERSMLVRLHNSFGGGFVELSDEILARVFYAWRRSIMEKFGLVPQPFPGENGAPVGQYELPKKSCLARCRPPPLKTSRKRDPRVTYI